MDFAANGAYLIATREFAGRLVRIDLHTLTVDGYLNLPGSSPAGHQARPHGAHLLRGRQESRRSLADRRRLSRQSASYPPAPTPMGCIPAATPATCT